MREGTDGSGRGRWRGRWSWGSGLRRCCEPPLVVILRGEVGAGKTTLVKGIAAALGAAAEDEVTSPTFTIVHEYVGRKVRLFHLDLYRLETEEQIAVLGLDEMAGYENSLVLVEWGERFESVVKMAGGEIYMEHGEGDERGLIVRLRN